MKHAILFAILSALSAWGNAQTSGEKGEEVICVDRTGEVKDIAEAMRRVTDSLTGETVAENADRFTCRFAAPDTRLFDLE